MNNNKLPSPELKEMPLFEHLTEMRKRLLYVILTIIAGSVVTFSFSKEIFAIITAPFYASFPVSSLIGTGPAEAFILRMKVAIFSSVIVTSPILFYQLWAFISPGLYPSERKLIVPFVIITTLLFLIGTFVCYKLILPFIFAFFIEQYTIIDLTPQIRVSEQFSLTMIALLGFGIMFETPVLAYFLARFGLLTDRILLNYWRYIIVGIFIASAVITPTPDILTMVLFAAPLTLLYGISIIVVRNAQPKNPSL